MSGKALLGWVTLLALGAGCATPAPTQVQAYAVLKTDRIFEYDLKEVWGGIETALRHQKIVDRKPSEVEDGEWSGLRERQLESDWIYTESRDKYIEYQINGSPRRKYHPMRQRLRVFARRVMGGTEVQVRADEEIQQLEQETGRPLGYESVAPDSARAAELLEKIQQGIFSNIGK